ncbi:threonine/serine exporter family protein [Limosilactobacillus fastidiosus]|uniref:Threonine/serine exporter family protein n=1 Tax=Limosilactobacillus fastidiosus TaxID=2759855 RepID=A0A7W3YBR2_9LACO|nr:threonine/serine exporter family protein [Limosilactobacillus fastidiosus]MBB1085964.1 threonine/serine exporter family protein [Limosilactobacillus fastidiosus]MCD7085699.1 threonine/serine exporter family protein [Limosilactobacillus fastidiosus]MCD7114093.1 threonine/serine exporter family protein [Limosilactobacillus fastidiosus]MCD7116773.1 threonine/serine exporter family protein [Limosilactobacillus fastidiosus]
MNWENLFLQFILSYASTVCFGILLHIPARAYNMAGIIGGGVWEIYWLIYYHHHVGLAISNLLAAILISLFSMAAARHLKMPMIVFNVPALVTFVPGGQAYKMVRNFALGNYPLAMFYLYQVVVIVGAITLGFGLGELIIRAVKYIHTLSKSSKSKV